MVRGNIMRARTRDEKRITYRPKPNHTKYIESMVKSERIHQTTVIDRALDLAITIPNLDVVIKEIVELRNAVDGYKLEIEELRFVIRKLVVSLEGK
jgi:hypothetical protein